MSAVPIPNSVARAAESVPYVCNDRHYSHAKCLNMEEARDRKPENKAGSLLSIDAIAEGSTLHGRVCSPRKDHLCVLLGEPLRPVYSRTARDAQMTLRPYADLFELTHIPSRGGQVALAQLYEAVEFSPKASVAELPKI